MFVLAMTPSKHPSAKSSAHSPGPSNDGMQVGLGDLMGSLVGGILEQVKQLAGWVGHPLAKPLDAAELSLAKGSTGGTVTTEEMARGLEVQQRGLTGATVHVVGSDAAVGVNVGGGTDTIWVVLVGDDRDLGRAFHQLKEEIAEEHEKFPACHDVVFWTRKWDAPAWSKAFGDGLGALAPKPLWVKLWDANGTLVGPITRAPPPVVPMPDLSGLRLDLDSGL